MERDRILKKVHRIVIKIGTSSITTDFKLDKNKLKILINQISTLRRQNYEIVLVTSGAISAGAGVLKLSSRPEILPMKQACASIGQSVLMNYYSKLFEREKIIVSQILLTRNDLKNRQSYLNARNTIFTLLKYKVLPIVNENDTVATEEIIFGDNDTLSALVCLLIDGDLLVILSDVDGFYLDGKIVSNVTNITKQMEENADDSASKYGTGGMKTKLKSAKIVTKSGGAVIIANSNKKNILLDILMGKEIGTFFFPTEKQISARKRWIAYSLTGVGKIIIDEGAEEAIVKKNKSLLPSGIIRVEDKFKLGDGVDIYNNQNKLIGRGIVNYNSKEIEKIMGKKTTEISSILGFKSYDEVISRDNLVIL